MPDHVNCMIEEKIFWVSHETLIMERVLSVSGIPLCDNSFRIIDVTVLSL